MRNLTGKTALVTGVTGGIGPYIVRELAKEQMKLVLAARIASQLEKIARQLRQEGHQVLAIPKSSAFYHSWGATSSKGRHRYANQRPPVARSGMRFKDQNR